MVLDDYIRRKSETTMIKPKQWVVDLVTHSIKCSGDVGSDNESIVWIVDMEGSIQVYQEEGETVVAKSKQNG